MLLHGASLPLSRQPLTYATGVFRRHRKKTGSKGRALPPGLQVLASTCQGTSQPLTGSAAFAGERLRTGRDTSACLPANVTNGSDLGTQQFPLTLTATASPDLWSVPSSMQMAECTSCAPRPRTRSWLASSKARQYTFGPAHHGRPIVLSTEHTAHRWAPPPT